MHRSVVRSCWLLAVLLGASTAQAQSLWVGNWIRVPEASRRSPHSFTLAVQPGGALRYDNGGDVLVLASGSEPTPKPFQPNASIRTTELTPVSFSYEEIVAEKAIARLEERLSADGQRLIGRRVSIANDGRERAREVLAVRVGRGHGLTGRWRELPPPRANGGSTLPPPASPFWVITQDAAGEMTWTIPATGEVLRGAANGQLYPVSGALQLPGRTFTLKALSPRHLLWSFYENGHLVEHAEELLSADGKLWTDLIWKPAYPDEKDRFVYRRG